METVLEQLKKQVRSIGARYADREMRARRLFIEERPASLSRQREKEFDIKTEISQYFKIPYSSIHFCGSAQLGFSIYKDKLFELAISDLDVACVNTDLFQKLWIDIVKATRSFTDSTPFGVMSVEQIELFKEQILKRGMIRIKVMPKSQLSQLHKQFEGQISRKHTATFNRITLAVYMNEYAFCWKQDSALSTLMG